MREDFFIEPRCPECAERVSGIIGSEKLYCFQCKVELVITQDTEKEWSTI